MIAKPKSAHTDVDMLDWGLRRDFPTFLHFVFRIVSPHDKFVASWHLSAIGLALNAVEWAGETRLIINMPPRSLKSITISVAWVAWMLGKDPSLRFICVSYSNELAVKMARDCRTVMQSDTYRRVFPRTVLKREAEHDLETTSGGGRYATSVGGTLTGRGADYIVIDDPMKPDDAQSEVGRQSVIEWYTGTLSSRLNNKTKGAIILVMQRLHEADLTGHLLESGEEWSLLTLPAIAEEEEHIPLLPPAGTYHRKAGEALQPEREPLWVLEGQKRSMGSAAFAAQYQQAPVPKGGNLVRRTWLCEYDEPPSTGRGRIVQSWDCASKTGLLNDFSVCVTALIVRSEVFILDVFRGRLAFPDLVKKAVELAERYRPDVMLIEDAASGTQLIQELMTKKLPKMLRPLGRKPEGDKTTRLSGCTGMIEAGGLFLPRAAPWRADFDRELLAFPSGKHDDQVDALSQLLIYAREQPVLPVFAPLNLEKGPGDHFRPTDESRDPDWADFEEGPPGEGGLCYFG